MIETPELFRPKHPIEYPAGNKVDFEHWFYYNYKSTGKRAYLPVMWTSFYCRHKFGKDQQAIDKLQEFLNDIDPDYK